MRLIVGLGNIGEQYKNTNHNAGFMVADGLAEKLGVKFSRRGCDADYAEANVEGCKLILAKPRTFMNSSGLSVKSFVKKFKINAQDILVVSDDIDLDPGKIRIRKFGSAGTHNGLKSIVSELGTEQFCRLRVGIGQKPEHFDLADFVLSNMRMTDAQRSGILRAVEAAQLFASGEDIEKIMSKYNGEADKNGMH